MSVALRSFAGVCQVRKLQRARNVLCPERRRGGARDGRIICTVGGFQNEKSSRSGGGGGRGDGRKGKGRVRHQGKGIGGEAAGIETREARERRAWDGEAQGNERSGVGAEEAGRRGIGDSVWPQPAAKRKRPARRKGPGRKPVAPKDLPGLTSPPPPATITGPAPKPVDSPRAGDFDGSRGGACGARANSS